MLLESSISLSAMMASLKARYQTIGAVCESSRWLAQSVSGAITAPGSHPVVELGAGYGSVTRRLPESTISIERDKPRFDYLKQTFPDRAIIDSCAISFISRLERPSVVVSSIPSINNPEFNELRAAIGRAHGAGYVRELVTYTYFLHNPFGGIFPRSEVTSFEMRNVPPAFVWRYTC
jgi:phospholipid N-methyltransferase